MKEVFYLESQRLTGNIDFRKPEVFQNNLEIMKMSTPTFIIENPGLAESGKLAG